MNDEFTEAGDFSLDAATRLVRGLLMPWDEVSRPSNVAPISFARGTLKIPRDVTVLNANRRHDRHDPVARFTRTIDTERGLVAEFAIANSDEGDTFIREHAAGKLRKLSPEVVNIVRNGVKAVSAALTGAGFVDEGAFKSAALFALNPDETVDEAPPADDPAAPKETTSVISDEFVDEAGVKHKRTITTTTRTETVDGVEKTTITEKTVIEEPGTQAPNPEEEPPVGVATAPNTLGTGDFSAAQPVTKREAFATFEAIRSGTFDAAQVARLHPSFASQAGLFALNDVKYDGDGSVQPDERRAQWVDELWDGREFVQQIIPLFSHADLTAKTIKGFRWTNKPAGGWWAGNKNNIPSNVPTTAPATATAEMWAGGHDHAIEHQIFDTPGYFESYFKAMTESYADDSDLKAFENAYAGATPIEADNPAGLSIGAGFSALIDGATEVITAGKALPTFALVAPALWKSMMKTTQNNVLGYLDAALGLEAGSLAGGGFILRPYAGLEVGEVLVGAKEAMTVFELPGTPIRVTAPDTVKGGIDTNVIAAFGTLVNKTTALQLVTPYTA